ncbi:hypothetical protein BU24DRAFT_430380 [Aaosphaeria arxii CBS 175.79]|uniref:DUF7729 domain-containing protein n=1 Tax=Aaosphaeria arxii CBS 175.79 TaxID=1450172 RepID=A0A6A5Y9D0_9PLEO|nr:uncharacterized protein BU24DRAFT_430380 [Aaosphaeria arxii CBS 175.79]KAF2021866.1 hypothetical protein BU24DRAFT_430380 [Aaosphaeria arxii CBS 175.79]
MPLYRRQNDNDETTSSTKTASTPTSKSASLKTEPTASSSPFVVPKPFDTALSNNFTAGCATFFRRLLGDETFQQCHPFSLLLQTSSGFFDASKSYIRITQTLEATCRANETICTDAMNGLARELVQDSNCATDYSNDNPQVLQAYNGLIAYEPLYQASCLRDSEGSYCYANAVTNTSATTDSYPYYLPLGVDLPGGARPTCNSCLQNAMAIFSAFAGNTSQPISKTYNAGAQQIQVACGPQFVNKTATPQKGAASPALATASFAPTITLIAMIFVFLFQ